MQELRRIRFADINGLQRDDLPIACEVWIGDVLTSTWASREAGKLATYLTRYICGTHGAKSSMRRIENQCQLSKDVVRQNLVLLRAFGAIDEFNIEDDVLSVSIALTFSQRVRVLELLWRFNELVTDRERASGHWQPSQSAAWQPPVADPADEAAAA